MGIWTSLATFPGFSWVEKHEKLIIVVAICLAGLWGTSKVLGAWEKHDEKQLQIAAAQSAADKAAVAQALQQNATDKAAAAADKAATMQLVQAVTAQNAALNQAMAARDKATQNQQKIDLHATITELSTRFSALVPGVNPQDILISKDGNTVTVGTDTAQKTVTQLEEVPRLQADLKDTQQKVTNLESEIRSMETYTKALETEVATQDKTIALLQKELADDAKTCDARVKVESDKARGAYLKGLKHGTIIGVILGLFVGHAVGI